MDRVRRTGGLNPYWNQFENVSERGDVTGKVTVSPGGTVSISKKGWFGWSTESYQRGADVPPEVAALFRR